MQKALLVLALLGVSMVIGDGVLTAAASVMSAMSGLQVANSSISNSERLLLIEGLGSQQLLLPCGGEEQWALITRICAVLMQLPYLHVRIRLCCSCCFVLSKLHKTCRCQGLCSGAPCWAGSQFECGSSQQCLVALMLK